MTGIPWGTLEDLPLDTKAQEGQCERCHRTQHFNSHLTCVPIMLIPPGSIPQRLLGTREARGPYEIHTRSQKPSGPRILGCFGEFPGLDPSLHVYEELVVLKPSQSGPALLYPKSWGDEGCTRAPSTGFSSAGRSGASLPGGALKKNVGTSPREARQTDQFSEPWCIRSHTRH